jgi:hypothetical protein
VVTAVVVTAVVVTVAAVMVAMEEAMPEAIMVVATRVLTSVVVMAVDTVILPAPTMALLISVRATLVETTGLRAVEIISTTTRSAIGTTGIILPGSAGPAGALGVAVGVAGEVGSDRCSGRFF